MSDESFAALMTVTEEVISSDQRMMVSEVDAPVVVGCLPPLYYEEIRTRSDVVNDAGVIVGFDEQVSGLGYVNITHYDLNGNYIGSEFNSSNGYYSKSERVEKKDPEGNLTGYSEVSSGGDGQYSYKSQSDFDVDWNLQDSFFKDSSGYYSSSHKHVNYDEAGKVVGYVLVSEGGNSVQGDYYQTTDIMDVAGNVISSEYKGGNGYSSLTVYETLVNDAGEITGHRTTSSWSYQNGEVQKSVQEYDSSWNLVFSDEPAKSIDDGLVILPVCDIKPVEIVAEHQAIGTSKALSANVHVKENDDLGKLKGGAGDDIYYLNNKHDKVVDHGESGEDAVTASDFDINLSRSNYIGVEDAYLQGVQGLKAVGSAKDNKLSGNSGDNVINGKYGSDVLFGGLGADKFVFDTRLSAKSNLDSIVDFKSGVDTICLDHRIFRAYKQAGADLSYDLVVGDGATAQDISDHFIYDTASSTLYYDPDGSGSREKIAFVTLTGVSELNVSDLVVV